MNLLKDKHVAIIGAGPVGLTFANLLHKHGIDFSVYEWDKNAQTRVAGGTLDLSREAGQKALKAAGILDYYYELARPTPYSVADKEGRVIFLAEIAPEDEKNEPEIDRTDLRSILLRDLPADRVKWDHRFTALEKQDDHWLIRFSEEHNVKADVIIGANGGLSSIRGYLTDSGPEYTGTFGIQGEIEDPATNAPGFGRIVNHNLLMVASNGNLLIAQPKRNGAIAYYVTFRRSEDWVAKYGPELKDPAKAREFLLKELADWHEDYKQLFRATTTYNTLSLRVARNDTPWNKNRLLPVTLIGDAAHIMPPFAGMGVNIGMLDALNLTNNLTSGKFGSIQEAFNDYERNMFKYAGKAQDIGAQNEIALQQPDFDILAYFQQHF